MIIIRLKESDPTRAQDAEQNYVDPKWFKVAILSAIFNSYSTNEN